MAPATGSSGSGANGGYAPQTVVVDLHNPRPEPAVVELGIDRSRFPGHLSLMVSPLEHAGGSRIEGLCRTPRHHAPAGIVAHLEAWLAGLGEEVERFGRRAAAWAVEGFDPREARRAAMLDKLCTVDPSHVLVVEDPAHAAIGAVHLGPHGRATCAVTLAVPESARPGDTYRFDLVQRSGGRILGGGTYLVAVTGRAHGGKHGGLPRRDRA